MCNVHCRATYNRKNRRERVVLQLLDNTNLTCAELQREKIMYAVIHPSFPHIHPPFAHTADPLLTILDYPRVAELKDLTSLRGW
jgi:hypothetical protein